MGERKNVWGFGDLGTWGLGDLGTWGIIISLSPYLPISLLLTTVNFAHPSLIFTPIFEAIPAFATTPALTIVWVLMMASITSINWEDLTEAIPAFLTIFFIPFAFSIAAGLSIGLIAYPLLKTFKGKARDVPIITWILAAIFIARFIFMTLRFG